MNDLFMKSSMIKAENFAEISAAGIFKSIKILYKKCLKMSPLKFDELHYYVLCELY